MTYTPGGDKTEGIIPPPKTVMNRPPTPKPKMELKEKKIGIVRRIINAAKSQNEKNSPFKR